MHFPHLLIALKESGWGDLASIAGVCISLLGFWLAITSANEARDAARRADETASRVSQRMTALNSLFDLSTAANLIEEIKRLHRDGLWSAALYRYRDLRMILISVRAGVENLSDEDRKSIQRLLNNLRQFEDKIEQGLRRDLPPENAERFNNVITRDLERLLATTQSFRREIVDV